MSLITQIDIAGLNGSMDLIIPLRGKHCIIVGPNGSGKSTALQIIAYALGRQWKALASSRFSSITFHFGKSKFATISKEACDGFSRSVAGNPRFSRLARDLSETNNLESFIAAD